MISTVLIGSTLVSTFSVAVAVDMVLAFSWLAGVFVAVWGVFTLYVDRWMLATLVSAGAWARLRIFLPRLLMATVFGVVIAEPLVLGVFRSAIDVQLGAAAQTADLLTRLRAFEQIQQADPSVVTAAWSLRLFLIVVSTLPALLAMLGGRNPYQAAVAAVHRERTMIPTRSNALVTERVATLAPGDGHR
ncbi:DUF4407 domain-containing protein [Asanoa ishikariensis]|uniref:DUF4407 domain-containing protein n=1 Tax=Asanoa ishikariensis TaxID=137265 RepID=UPI0015A00293|nr:DUF4407 domain-containing protein [Asanoa ishikariensis]